MSTRIDIGSGALHKTGISAQSIAGGATVDGTGFDTTGFEWAYIALNAGVIGANGIVIKAQESDVVGSGYTDITGAVFTIVDANDNTPFSGQIELRKRSKKFLRITATCGATNACVIGVSVLLSGCQDTEHWAPTTLTFNVGA